MSPEQWQQLNDLFQSALQCDPNDRAIFIEMACAGDEELRTELKSLIEAYERAPSFIDKPAIEAVAEFLAYNHSPSLVGRSIAHYRIERKLGSGGMGDVYLARDVKLGRNVALKVLPSVLTHDEDHLLRFRQEARAVSALNHPNIVTVYDVGETSDAYYIVTEFIEGETLRERLIRGQLTLQEVLDISIQVAGALEAAQIAGIVHRDIKPENIILRPDGYVKVLDFGIAKLTARQINAGDPAELVTLQAKTSPGVVIGTANYMSPEQARGIEVDARTDIFSLGVVIYELVVGRTPFEGDTINHVIISILEKEPLPLVKYLPNVPAKLDRIVSKALIKDKKERYQTVGEVLADLKILKQDIEIKAKLGYSLNGQKTEEPVDSPGTKRTPVGVTDELGGSIETSSDQSITGKLRSFYKRIILILRSNRRVRRFLFFSASILILFNPILLSFVLRSFNLKLPSWLIFVWGSATILLLISLAFLVMRTIKSSAQAPLSDRRAIKGLRPFSYQDANVFARLQRDASLRECLATILDEEFRFGMLCGESGCGKTSFLQAGIWPNLSRQKHGSIYVKFSDLNPIESIREAINEQLDMPKGVLESASLLALFETVIQVHPEPLILLFDQFEQFFVHRKRKSERKSFVQDLAKWFQQCSSFPIKILVCIRGDFTYRLIELQKAMGYSLGPSNSFRLEKFEPGEAAEVFHVIADTEGITFDEDFVREIITQELASREDGLISPVDIQILAWMVASQRDTNERAFNRRAYQKLGGVEGLLERFLRKALKIRETESRQQTAIKTLLSLTDLERNARGRALSISEVKMKMAGAASQDEIEETIRWLARSDVRLITPIDRNNTNVYELAHERLIPALRRIAGQQLSETDRASQLLDQRVNEWLVNNRRSRFLLRWSELRLIQQHRSFLIWGTHKDQKELFISRSSRRLRFRTASVSIILIVALSFWGFLYSPSGQIWRVKQDLLSLSETIDSGQARLMTIEAFALLGDFDQALKMTDKLDDLFKPSARISIARAYARIGKVENNNKLLDKGRRLVEELNSTNKMDLLPLAQFYAEVGDPLKANSILDQMCQGLEKKGPEDVYDFSYCIEACIKIGNHTKAAQILELQRKIIEMYDPNSRLHLLPVLAQEYAESGNHSKAYSLIEAFYQALGKMDPELQADSLPRFAEACISIFDTEELLKKLADTEIILNRLLSAYPDKISLNNQDNSLVWLAKTYVKSGLTKKDKRFLEKAQLLSDRLGPENRYLILAESANVSAKIQDRDNGRELTRQVVDGMAVDSTSRLDQFRKARVCSIIAECYARIGDWSKARQIAQRTGDDSSHMGALIRILNVWSGQEIPDLDDYFPMTRFIYR